MKKLYGIVIGILTAVTLCFSVQAADIENISVENIDESVLQQAFAAVVNNDGSEITVHVSRKMADGEMDNLKTMVYDIQNLWAYRAPEIYNYTHVSMASTKREDSYDLKLTLIGEDGADLATAHAQKRTAEAKAAEVYAKLVADGMIPEDASDTEIARVVLDWVCKNVAYKNDGKNMCHTAYSAFVNGYAVCDGYTSAYNLILKQAGIHCYGIKGYANGCHEWTAAVLDGSLKYIDSTWADNNDGEVNLKYFAANPTDMSDHTAYFI